MGKVSKCCKAEVNFFDEKGLGIHWKCMKCFQPCEFTEEKGTIDEIKTILRQIVAKQIDLNYGIALTGDEWMREKEKIYDEFIPNLREAFRKERDEKILKKLEKRKEKVIDDAHIILNGIPTRTEYFVVKWRYIEELLGLGKEKL